MDILFIQHSMMLKSPFKLTLKSHICDTPVVLTEVYIYICHMSLCLCVTQGSCETQHLVQLYDLSAHVVKSHLNSLDLTYELTHLRQTVHHYRGVVDLIRCLLLQEGPP